MTTMRCGLVLGTGKLCDPTEARVALPGSGYSQVLKGKDEGLESAMLLAVGRNAIVSALARRLIGYDLPSIRIFGQLPSALTTLATARPFTPRTTHAAFNSGSAPATADSISGNANRATLATVFSNDTTTSSTVEFDPDQIRPGGSTMIRRRFTIILAAHRRQGGDHQAKSSQPGFLSTGDWRYPKTVRSGAS